MGKTRQAKDVTSLKEKHPHERGEDIDSLKPNQALTETPPRAWGRPPSALRSQSDRGNTPTSVGKTCKQRSHASLKRETPPRAWGRLRAHKYGCLMLRKHPHERGEDLVVVCRTHNVQETPPRAWGRLQMDEEETRQAGNTPTSVGKTQEAEIYQTMHRKHPHERGEDVLSASAANASKETPPRAWGRPYRWLKYSIYLGNTPTSVGKTTAPTIPLPPVLETPPRAWGRLTLGRFARAVNRNTPTSVGKTSADTPEELG